MTKNTLLTFIAFTLMIFSINAQYGWKKASFPGLPRDGAATFSIGNKGYVCGGEGNGNLKDCWEFDQSGNKWKRIADMPAERAFGSGFSIGSKGYVVLGTETSLSDMKKTLWEYNSLIDSWNLKAEFPGASRFAAGCFVINSKAYVGAGFDLFGSFPKDFYEYNPSNNTWNPKANILYGTNFPACFSFGSKGYLMETDALHTFEYDPIKDKWLAKANFPGSSRTGTASFIIDGIAYVGQGSKPDHSEFYNDFYTYHVGTDTWSSAITNCPMTNRCWASGMTIGTKGYIGLGVDSLSNHPSEWWEFDPSLAGITWDVGKNKEVSIYPNPTSCNITIELNENTFQNSSISISNILGNVLWKDGEAKSRSINLDLKSLVFVPGIYFIGLENEQLMQKVILTN